MGENPALSYLYLIFISFKKILLSFIMTNRLGVIKFVGPNFLTAHFQLFLEKPQSSSGARIWASLNIIVILISVCNLISESMPAYRNDEKANRIFFTVDASCVSYFTIGKFVEYQRPREMFMNL